MIEFSIDGIPVPQGSMRAISINGRARVFHNSDKKLRIWRSAVAQAAAMALDGNPGYDEPVNVWMEFRLPRPPSTRREAPSVKPDLDKLIRAVLDALEQSGVIKNDSRVCHITAQKSYAELGSEPGMDLAVVSEREGLLDDGIETVH